MIKLVIVFVLIASTIGESSTSSDDYNGGLQGGPGPIAPKREKDVDAGFANKAEFESRMLEKFENADKGLIEMLRVYPTCDHIPGGDDRRDGAYWINPAPERLQRFHVFCNFSGESPETIIQHDSMNEVRFSGCEPAFCYQRNISYSASLRQIVALIEASMECRQFIKLRSNGVNSDDKFAAWVSRGGQREPYWGGATSRRPNNCACGETGTHLGCYVDNAQRDLPDLAWSSATMDTTVCIIHCAEGGFMYAGTQFGDQCYCGNTYGNFGKADEKDCNLACAGNPAETCGGTWRNSIYATGIEYLGCYVDGPQRDLPNLFWNSATMNTTACINHCAKGGYMYAGTQYRDQCFCGNTYGNFGKANETDCHLACAGNPAETCGGSWRNSIYATGFSVRPQDRCNCDREGGAITSDEGFLTDKEKLPVIKLEFGDNGDVGEEGWHTLGPLRCSGRK